MKRFTFLLSIILVLTISSCKQKEKPVHEFTFQLHLTFMNGDQDTVIITSKQTVSADANIRLSDKGCLYIWYSDLHENNRSPYEYCGVRRFNQLNYLIREIPK